MFRSVITGTGTYIPTVIRKNEDFSSHRFFDEHRQLIDKPIGEIIQKFSKITGIEERRYVSSELNNSDIGALAAREAVRDSGIDPETLDQIIFAHNFGNVYADTIQTDAVPSLASHVKHALGIKNPACIPYDVLFGCPGWIQGVIQADSFFKSGMYKKALVIGSETLSRVIDSHDRDSMIFSDGAGAAVLEYRKVATDGAGILGFAVESHSLEEVDYIHMGPSYLPESSEQIRYIKMKGRKVYEYAMNHVPAAMKTCLDRSGIHLSQVKKIFIHQANEKMDEGMARRLYQLYGMDSVPKDIMPMSIHWLGNSSVATVPTLLDMVRKNLTPEHSLEPGDVILLASVGAGMNINALCYRV